jgi:hypothetical protein
MISKEKRMSQEHNARVLRLFDEVFTTRNAAAADNVMAEE